MALLSGRQHQPEHHVAQHAKEATQQRRNDEGAARGQRLVSLGAQEQERSPHVVTIIQLIEPVVGSKRSLVHQAAKRQNGQTRRRLKAGPSAGAG